MKSIYGLALACGLLLTVPADSIAAATESDVPQRWYLGIGAGSLGYREDGVISTQVGYEYLQAGWQLGRYAALEARVGTDGFGSSGIDFVGVPIDLKVRSFYGAYLRGILPLGSRWDLYGLLGYTTLTLRAEAYGMSVNETASSMTYGLGASWLPRDWFSIDLEYLPTLVDGDGWRGSGLNLGLRVRF
jgi:opacity protein-like surface antigen